MTIHVLSSSHQGLDWAQSGIEEYRKRILRFRNLQEHNISRQKLTSKSVEEMMKQDAMMIEEKIPKQSLVLLLHEEGKQHTSQSFAKTIEKGLLSYPNITFIIGPAYGLSRALLKKYPCLSLSQMTMQHEIAHVVLYEQIYRALTILNNHPYHR